MEKLKQIIESTLLNKINPNYTYIEFEQSVDICSDYIAQEIIDIAIEFAIKVATERLKGIFKNPKEHFNQFINDKYKE